MAKRSNPSNSGSDDDAPKKKKSRTTKQVSSDEGSSTARTRVAKTTAGKSAVSAATNSNNSRETVENSHTTTLQLDGAKNSATSFLKSAREAKSQPTPAKAPVATTAPSTQNAAPKSNGNQTTTDVNDDFSRRRSGVLLSICLFAANVASASYILSQRTFHNLAQMRCASTVHKLQLELSNTKEEMKLLRKAIETLEGGNQNTNVLLGEGMKTMFGSSIDDHKQLLTSNDIEKWQQLWNTLEEDKLMAKNNFDEKLKALL